MKPAILHSELATTTAFRSAATWDPKQLTNRFDQPFAIHTILFTMIAPNLTGLASPLAFAGVRIWAGAFELTRGIVPLGCLAPVIDREVMVPTIDTPTVGMPGTSQFAWEFAKPLVLPPNTSITVQLVLDGTGWPGDQAPLPVWDPLAAGCSVTLIGRIDPKGALKGKIPVPYASAWLSPVIAATNNVNASLVARSKTTDLGNPFSVPLFVKNMINSNVSIQSLGQPFVNSPRGWMDGYFNGTDFTLSNDWTVTPTYQVYHSGPLRKGVASGSKPGTNYVLAAYTPAKSIFSDATREWRMNAALAPKEYFQFNAQGTLLADSTAGTFNYFQHRVGMTGFTMQNATDVWHR